jgi:hypothetical protein
MGLLSFGGSKSKSSTSSQASAYGYSGSESVQGSISQGISGGTARSGQDIAFADLFANLYGGATGAAGRAAIAAPGLSDQAGMLFSGGLDFLDRLGGGAGAGYLEDRLRGDSGILEAQIGQLEQDMGRLFSEQLNPAITSQHVAGGTLGGGRQGVAQAGAAGQVAREFGRGVTELRAMDQAQRDQIARDAGAMTQAGAGAGLAALPGLYGLAEAGNLAELSPYMSLAQIMGGPTTLTTSESQQFSQDQAIAQAISRAFGEDFSKSSSKGSSKSSRLSLGFG